MTTQDVTLLPCPFCGNEATVKYNLLAYIVGCNICDAVMEVGYEYEWQAIAAWNRRTPLPDDERATLTAQVASLKQQLATEQEDNDASDEHYHAQFVIQRARIEALQQQLQAQAGTWEPGLIAAVKILIRHAEGKFVSGMDKIVAKNILKEEIKKRRWHDAGQEGSES